MPGLAVAGRFPASITHRTMTNTRPPPPLSASPAWLLGGLHRPILLKRSEVLFESPICFLRVVHELPYGHRIERQGLKDDGSRLVSRRDLGRDLPVIDPAPAVRAQVLEMHLERGDEGVLGLGLDDEGALGFEGFQVQAVLGPAPELAGPSELLAAGGEVGAGDAGLAGVVCDQVGAAVLIAEAVHALEEREHLIGALLVERVEPG